MPMFLSIEAIELSESNNCVHDVRSGVGYSIHESNYPFTKKVLTTRNTGILTRWYPKSGVDTVLQSLIP